MWVVGEVTENGQRAEQAALFPLGPLHHIQNHSTPAGLPCPGEHLRLRPLLRNRLTKTTKYVPKERTDQGSRKKIQPSKEEIANLSDAQFKTLVIGMLKEIVEYG